MNSDFKADLHCHSSCSDGQLSPLELLNLAHSKELKGLSITDHDTVEAYTPELFDEAKSLGIVLCTGVEFSCQLNDVNVHVLGYNFDLSSERLKNLCIRHQHRRKHRNAKILKKLAANGMPIDEEELSNKVKTNVIGRPHIAYLMIEKGYVTSISEAFQLYIGDGKSCFDPGESFSIDETLEILHEAQGKGFIAHPHLTKRRKILRELLKKPFDGLECYYGNFRASENAKWLDIANRQNWLVSGGSDFHGDLKPYISLGSSWVDEVTLAKIMQRN